MAIKFDVFEIASTRLNAEYPVNYRPRIVQAQTMTTKELAQKLTETTTLTNVDIESVLIGLGNVLKESIAQGRGLHIDNLGTFSPSLRFVDPTIPPERIKPSNVRLQNILFYPEREVLAEVQRTARFERGKAYHSENVTEAKLMLFLANFFTVDRPLLQKTLEHEMGVNAPKARRLLKALVDQGKLAVRKIGTTNFYYPGPNFVRLSPPETTAEDEAAEQG